MTINLRFMKINLRFPAFAGMTQKVVTPADAGASDFAYGDTLQQGVPICPGTTDTGFRRYDVGGEFSTFYEFEKPDSKTQ
jgi:hypothetical protein